MAGTSLREMALAAGVRTLGHWKHPIHTRTRTACSSSSRLEPSARSNAGKSGGPMSLVLTSAAFAALGAIPSLHTCEGRDVSPPLAWTGVPAAAKSLVLIVDDPDAPDPKAPKTTWVHWVLYNLPPSATSLAGGIAS